MYKAEIKSILKERRIEYLIHFTRASNLKSILEHGLVPVSDLENKMIAFVKNDKDRYDRKTDCISVSVEYPNTWVLKEYMKRENTERWVIIILDPIVIGDYNCYFAQHNAASSAIANSVEDCSGVDAFNRLFDECVVVPTTRGTRRFCRGEISNIQSYLPTSDQAEILVKGIIDSSYIKHIYFNSEIDAEILSEELRKANIRWSINKDIFKTERNAYRRFKVR